MRSIISTLFIWCIKGYQAIFSPDQGFLRHIKTKQTPTCMYFPTCSEYTIQAIQKYGPFKGVFMGIKRVWRCRPGKTPGVDLP